MSIKKPCWFSVRITLLCIVFTIGSASTALPPKSDSAYQTWNLNDLYPEESAWNAAIQAVKIKIDSIKSHENNFLTDAKSLLNTLDLISVANKQAARIYVYAALKSDEDLNDEKARKNLTEALYIFGELESATKFVAPAIETLGIAKIEHFIGQEPNLSRHEFRLKDILRRSPHTVNSEREQELRVSHLASTSARHDYRNMIDKSVLWPFITLESGQGLSLTPATYSRYRGVTHRSDRKAIFNAFWNVWRAHETRFGDILSQLIKSQTDTALLQNYNSALEQATSEDGMSVQIYQALIAAANKHLPTFHRYLELRSRLLKVEDLEYFDLYPEVTYSERRFTLQDAKNITAEAIKPYGKEYLDYLGKGFSAQWMHPYPQTGKRSGAYTQNAAYDVHPYLLLNFNKRFGGVSTFAHEWGHAVHAQFSRKQNSFETYTYSPFVGELASLTNEILIQEHMLAQDLTDENYLFYLTEALETIRANFFRQAMFAEFELLIHQQSVTENQFSGEQYSKAYLNILRKYHGHNSNIMNIDEQYALEWAYIPHFYSNFYVYQNATSVTGAAFFANKILAGNTDARESFINLLKAGGSDYPRNLLMQAGLDLESEAPYSALIVRMERLIDTANVILDRMGR